MTDNTPEMDGDRAQQFLNMLEKILEKRQEDLTLADVRDYVRVVNYNFIKLEETLLAIKVGLESVAATVQELVKSHQFIDDVLEAEKKPTTRRRKKKE